MSEDETPFMKRSLTIAGHATSVALEPIFWQGFDAIAKRRGLSAAALIAEIDATRTGGLASAIRVYVMRDVMARTNAKAG